MEYILFIQLMLILYESEFVMFWKLGMVKLGDKCLLDFVVIWKSICGIVIYTSDSYLN